MGHQANILDEIRSTLSPAIWDKPGDPEPKLKPHVARFIIEHIYQALEHNGYTNPLDWLNLCFTGSLTTYQYSDSSDCDISLFVDSDNLPEWSRAEMIGIMISHADGTKIPGTPYPLQDFVVARHLTPADLYRPGLRSGYDIDHARWINPPDRGLPHNVEQQENGFYVYALENADKMHRLLQYEPDKAVQFWHQIHARRQRDQTAGKGDYSEANIVYKFLEQRGLFPRIAEQSGEYIAKVAAETRTQMLQRAQTLPQDQSQIVHQWPDGWSMRQLQTYGDAQREGHLMNNCIGYDSTQWPHDMWNEHPDMRYVGNEDDESDDRQYCGGYPQHQKTWREIQQELAQPGAQQWTPQITSRVTQSSTELHVGLDIPEVAAKKIHSWCKEQEWPEGTEIEPPDDYHVTLMYTPDGYDEHKGADWIDHMGTTHVRVTGVDSFEAEEKGYAYVLRLDAPEVRSHAKSMQDRAEDHGLEITHFPGGYKPHLTVAYGPTKMGSETEVLPLEFDAGPSSVSTPRRDRVAAGPQPWQSPTSAPITPRDLSSPTAIARGHSRPVSQEEWQQIAEEGRGKYEAMTTNADGTQGIDQQWPQIKEHCWQQVQRPWGGATINAATGVPIEGNADQYAMTAKPPGVETVSIPIDSPREHFMAAMDEARKRYDPLLQRANHHLGVFRDEDVRRYDIDPVLAVDNLRDAESIGAHTRNVGGAYHFASGDGYWPPHVPDHVAAAPTNSDGTWQTHAQFRAANRQDLPPVWDPSQGV